MNLKFFPLEGNINSEIDSETEAESAEDKPIDSVHGREVKTAVDMLSRNNGDQGLDIEMEELGKVSAILYCITDISCRIKIHLLCIK